MSIYCFPPATGTGSYRAKAFFLRGKIIVFIFLPLLLANCLKLSALSNLFSFFFFFLLEILSVAYFSIYAGDKFEDFFFFFF